MNFFSFPQYAHLMRRSKSQVKRNERRVFVELLADADDDYHKFPLSFCVCMCVYSRDYCYYYCLNHLAVSRIVLLMIFYGKGFISFYAEYEKEEEKEEKSSATAIKVIIKRNTEIETVRLLCQVLNKITLLTPSTHFADGNKFANFHQLFETIALL